MLHLQLNDDLSEKIKYDYTDYPIYVRKALLSYYPNYTAPSHWHNDIEFIAVLSGKMQYNVNGEIVTIRAGEGVVVNSRQLHFGFSSKKKECEFICILLHPLMLCASSAYERDFVLPILNNPQNAFIKLDKETLWHRNIFETIKNMYCVKDEKMAPLKIQNLFLSTWINIYEHIYSENFTVIQNTEIVVLKNMIGFIQQNYGSKISLDNIAFSGAVGQSKCCKLFAKYIHQTPNMYLMQYRLDKSTELLKKTDMSITEIAHAVGFNSSSYYAEAFRKWYKKSPTKYRKELRNRKHP